MAPRKGNSSRGTTAKKSTETSKVLKGRKSSTKAKRKKQSGSKERAKVKVQTKRNSNFLEPESGPSNSSTPVVKMEIKIERQEACPVWLPDDGFEHVDEVYMVKQEPSEEDESERSLQPKPVNGNDEPVSYVGTNSRKNTKRKVSSSSNKPNKTPALKAVDKAASGIAKMKISNTSDAECSSAKKQRIIKDPCMKLVPKGKVRFILPSEEEAPAATPSTSKNARNGTQKTSPPPARNSKNEQTQTPRSRKKKTPRKSYRRNICTCRSANGAQNGSHLPISSNHENPRKRLILAAPSSSKEEPICGNCGNHIPYAGEITSGRSTNNTSSKSIQVQPSGPSLSRHMQPDMSSLCWNVFMEPVFEKVIRPPLTRETANSLVNTDQSRNAACKLIKGTLKDFWTSPSGRLFPKRLSISTKGLTTFRNDLATAIQNSLIQSYRTPGLLDITALGSEPVDKLLKYLSPVEQMTLKAVCRTTRRWLMDRKLTSAEEEKWRNYQLIIPEHGDYTTWKAFEMNLPITNFTLAAKEVNSYVPELFNAFVFKYAPFIRVLRLRTLFMFEDENGVEKNLFLKLENLEELTIDEVVSLKGWKSINDIGFHSFRIFKRLKILNLNYELPLVYRTPCGNKWAITWSLLFECRYLKVLKYPKLYVRKINSKYQMQGSIFGSLFEYFHLRDELGDQLKYLDLQNVSDPHLELSCRYVELLRRCHARNIKVENVDAKEIQDVVDLWGEYFSKQKLKFCESIVSIYNVAPFMRIAPLINLR